MKVTFSLFLTLLLCLVSCAKSKDPNSQSAYYEQNGKLKVLSTTAMIDDLVGKIGGEHVDHITLVTAQLDPHSYELVKGDDEKIAFASLVIGNGLNLEHGASLRYQLEQHGNTVFLADKIQQRFPNKILTVNGELDPHIWMDISIWAEGIDPIVEALSQLDPDHQQDYRHNGEVLRLEMLSTHQSILDELREVDEKQRYLVTSHDAFHYFTRAYLSEGQDIGERCMAPEGLAPDGQLSSQDILRVVNHLSRHQIGVVFPESNVNRDALHKIIASCKHPVYISDQSLYGDAMGDAGSGADTYLGMIQHNAKVLKEEWQAQLKSNR